MSEERFSEDFCKALMMYGPKAIQQEFKNMERYSESCEGNILKAIERLERTFFKILIRLEEDRRPKQEVGE